jgi:hypothetical protein
MNQDIINLFSYPAGYAFKAAVEKFSLVTLLYCADLEAGNILERKS